MNITQAIQALDVSHIEFIEYIKGGIIRYEEVPDGDGTAHTHIEYSDVEVTALKKATDGFKKSRRAVLKAMFAPREPKSGAMDKIMKKIDELEGAINSEQNFVVHLQAGTVTSEKMGTIYASLGGELRIEQIVKEILEMIDKLEKKETPDKEELNGTITVRKDALRKMLQDEEALPRFRSELTMVISGEKKSKTQRITASWAYICSLLDVARSGVEIKEKKEVVVEKENEK